ncbi:hypothetical protein VTN00DRAFT_5557 [Thermoascus crustaceus]|uniref:uncharacterized protein n=1 Tax=Thermoascus crustaceus TaxID=5088 RepID=UPI003742B335
MRKIKKRDICRHTERGKVRQIKERQKRELERISAKVRKEEKEEKKNCTRKINCHCPTKYPTLVSGIPITVAPSKNLTPNKNNQRWNGGRWVANFPPHVCANRQDQASLPASTTYESHSPQPLMLPYFISGKRKI